MLKLISIGLKLKDITLEALEEIKSSDIVYLEGYTSLGASVNELEKLTGKKIVKLNREEVESDKLVNEGKKKNVALLIYGDVFSATTHLSLIEGNVKIVNGISIFTSIGRTGLSLYNFGKAISIPFSLVKSPIDSLKENMKLGLHTLLLLDLDPINNKFLDAVAALKYLKENKINSKIIVCSALGTENEKIVYGKIDDLIKLKFDVFPQCLIVPGKMHFMEEDYLVRFEK
ncbi:diphthine synthase [Candidatus Woesearchaeota archaeon]|nr:diphthine synthase [Candidatus Woesearchaeota archaeon]